jgi:hypothetical protein
MTCAALAPSGAPSVNGGVGDIALFGELPAVTVRTDDPDVHATVSRKSKVYMLQERRRPTQERTRSALGEAAAAVEIASKR